MTTPDYLLPPNVTSLSQSYFSSRHLDGSADESSGSESVSGAYTRQREGGRTTSARTSGTHKPGNEPKFVGTPDYLCPESSKYAYSSLSQVVLTLSFNSSGNRV
jgi:hypothetical protein